MTRRCPNCSQRSEFEPLFTHIQDTWQCLKCEGWSYFSKQRQSPAELYSESYFRGGEYVNYEESSRIQKYNFLRKLKILRPFIPPKASARWLEIGSATGTFFEVLRDYWGIDNNAYLGIEVSEYARNMAKSKKITLYSPFDPQIQVKIKELRPNIIAAWDVWEHLETPADTLLNLFAACEATTYVAITTVDSSSLVAKIRGSKWRQYHPPTHLNYPSRKSFEIFFSAHSGEILSHRSFGYYRSAAEYLKILRSSGNWLCRHFPILYKTPIYCNLFDTQMVIGSITSALSLRF